MLLRKLMGIFACALIVGAASFAFANVPDLQKSEATTYDGPAGTPVLMNLPNGAGLAFSAAKTLSGEVDATITVTLIDGGDNPVGDFSREDLWLEAEDLSQEYAFFICVGGSIADANTDVDGVTQFVLPLRAGGCAQTVTYVMVNGAALTSNAGLAIWHNSPDINGDGSVNLSDVPEFAGDYFGGTSPFRSDFEYDGVVNLSDVVKLSQGLGAACP